MITACRDCGEFPLLTYPRCACYRDDDRAVTPRYGCIESGCENLTEVDGSLCPECDDGMTPAVRHEEEMADLYADFSREP